MKITGRIAKLELNRGEITETFRKQMGVQMRNAAREWLRAVYVRIPVWTGMARGALKFAQGRNGEAAGQFLASYLRVSIPIGPSRTADGKPLAVRKDRDPEAGGRQSRYTFGQSQGRFTFTYNTDVEHLIFNDQLSTETPKLGWPRPWLAFNAGETAFRSYLEANAKKAIPNLKDFIVKSDIVI